MERIIEFEGRRIAVPQDATDEEIAGILEQRPPQDTPGRRLGLGVRGVVEGVTALPGMVYDAAALPFNALGANIPPASQQVSGLLDRVGLPRPATRNERVTDMVVQGAAGVIPTMGAGAIAGGGNAIGRALTAAPVSQVVSGAAGGLAQGEAAEAGFGPAGQIAANLVAGSATGTAIEAGRTGGRLVSAAIEPFTEGGRQRIIADALLRGSADPETLPQRLAAGADAVERRLPGAVPTTAQAARDPGLLVMQEATRSEPRGQAGSIIRNAEAARDQVRNAAFDELSRPGNAETRGATVRTALAGEAPPEGGAPIGGARQAMTARTNQLYEQVDPNGTLRLGTGNVLARAEGQVAQMFGDRPPAELNGILGELRSVETIDWRTAQRLRSEAGEIAGKARQAGDARLASVAGGIVDDLEQAASSPRWAAATEQRRAMGAALGRDDSGANATGQILRTDRFGAPIVQDARAADIAVSTPANARQVLEAGYKALDDAVRARIPDAEYDALVANVKGAREAMRGQFIENWRNAATSRTDSITPDGGTQRAFNAGGGMNWWRQNEETARLLFSDRELAQLRRMSGDLAESALNAVANARGSPTAQNLAVGNMVSRVSGGLLDPAVPAAQAVFGVGNILPATIYAAPEIRLRQELARALVDPAAAQRALSNARPEAVSVAQGYMDTTTADRLKQAMLDALLRQGARTATSAAIAEPAR